MRGLAGAEADYLASTPRSRELHARAVRAMPGGSTRTTTFFRPYPLAIDRGEGCRVWDLDGTERLDFIGNYTAMVMGHAHPEILGALSAQAGRGTGFAAVSRLEVELAEELRDRVPSVELVRFCSSGTEATMFAMRLARVFTGRSRIARIEGGYHGTHDFAEVSHHPPPDRAGPADEPVPVPDSAGTPPAVTAATVVLPFNDSHACDRILRKHGTELAAVIVEPIMGAGAIPAGRDFLRSLRRVTEELGVLLIFDEGAAPAITPQTIADGTSAPYDPSMHQLLRDCVDTWLAVPEANVRQAIPRLAMTGKVVAEGAGALAYAALELLPEGPTTVAVISGGNVAADLLVALLDESS